MAQKETLSSLTHGNFEVKELSISAGKMPPNAVRIREIAHLLELLIDKKD